MPTRDDDMTLRAYISRRQFFLSASLHQHAMTPLRPLYNATSHQLDKGYFYFLRPIDIHFGDGIIANIIIFSKCRPFQNEMQPNSLIYFAISLLLSHHAYAQAAQQYDTHASLQLPSAR